MSTQIRLILECALLYSILFTLISLLNINNTADLLGSNFVSCDTSLDLEWANTTVFIAFIFLFVSLCSYLLSFVLSITGFKSQPVVPIFSSSIAIFAFNLYAVNQIEGSLFGACSWFLGKVILGSVICSSAVFVWAKLRNA